ncbi:1-acyl-sn-glycerol-3-phosphate acyltransferase [Anabaena cylindrica FACHB-243]|uniref:1-acyl-sn-glycerol-3-phosphate acyltransferase n=1 Tax=Anabaena cylindrica (strain ATCC 27899 / PCC 7122) TaxID=272123 RepID=K9ZPN3_ANACC|nr:MULTISPECIES: lysophospholipid acyltransferase family protein [Anabaena]AFZ60517.1 1-acyl-sn-glycerol-3-phosphate acyltransferase [Anabaena cylindrica PCC 7122]MBD2419018.1 1-acyl-sn-glycerol-3-phosphate acyltransferase [Anabaena cylindrica FACHB-243]MBY5282918.1 1-acyl-sn-glycerol-3-phosphate acyltransferase [Anabaena sp. CCAP 1446/1C]MBY5309975.1 1-acyl-sn-glycerol-3-phosphate acyltransferase [Anabaena sp. CCAP 1446/1C]MCM2407213.1 1-acyl-sn-glycerol-3-phosphate acyltransferase [Anabaena 
MTREREPFISLALYYAFKWSVVSPTLHTYFRIKIYGVENVPQTGPLLVVSNHASYFDPPIVSNCVRRPVAYMAKEELFKVPVLAQAIKLYGAYPVSRGSADRAAIRAALECLDNGWAVGVFLEGTRTPDGRITDPKKGAALLAGKAKVPFLPVSLWGTDKILQPGSSLPRAVPITVRIGKVIDAPSSTNKQELEAMTQKCATVINEMHDLGR